VTVAETATGAGIGVNLKAALEPLLARATDRATDTLLSVSRPVAEVDPIALHWAARALGASLWMQPSEDVALVGIGEAWGARPGGSSRFASVSQAWSTLLSTALVDAVGAPRGGGPLLLGGFSFSDEPVPSEIWKGFEPACLVLPGLLYAATPEGSWLTASMVLEPGLDGALVAASLEGTWRHLSALGAAPATDLKMLQVMSERPEAPAWRASVARLAGAVGRGRLDKAVLSRQVSMEAASEIEVTGVMSRLAASAPESTLFAFSRDPRTFVGATPERLVSLQGRELRTVAMAGSTRRAADVDADARLAKELLGSDKEREEHEVVVAMLRESLAPVVEELHVGARPEVVRLRHVQHLVTPLSGRLRADADVLTLVERLHPTPAVGGMPRDLALELIDEEEPHERGWYAGPLGWIDRHGDGEFVVALRSGVVHGREATLFAGCGIVADSDPDREWDESSAKLLALGSALGRIEP